MCAYPCLVCVCVCVFVCVCVCVCDALSWSPMVKSPSKTSSLKATLHGASRSFSAGMLAPPVSGIHHCLVTKETLSGQSHVIGLTVFLNPTHIHMHSRTQTHSHTHAYTRTHTYTQTRVKHPLLTGTDETGEI